MTNGAENKKKAKAREPLFHVARRASMPVWQAWLIRVAAFAAAMIFCGLLAFLLIKSVRENPASMKDFYWSFIKGSFSTPRKIFKFLKDTSVLLCIALAVTPAFRMKFWNIGAEGQTLVGVLASIAVAFYLGGKIPEWQLLILMFLAALLAGAVWAFIPALFKAKWNTNETLFTLMMNYVATFLVSYCLLKWVPSGSSSLGKLKYGALPMVTAPKIGNTYLPILIIAVVMTAALYVYLYNGKHGYEISVVGGSENTARYVGINVKKVVIRTMIISGALCGLAGYMIAAGLDQTVTPDSVGGQGFTAIIVSWLAPFNPLFMVITAALVIFLQQGASQISQVFDISGDFPNVVVGVILLFIIGSEFFINYRIVRTEKKEGK